MVQEINAASNEQTLGAQQINKEVQQLDQVVQQNASASEELAATAEELNSQAERLKEIVAFFKVDSTMGGFRQETIQADILPHSSLSSQPPASISSNDMEYGYDLKDEYSIKLNMGSSGNGNGKSHHNGNGKGKIKAVSYGNGNGSKNGNGNGKTVIHEEDFIRF